MDIQHTRPDSEPPKKRQKTVEKGISCNREPRDFLTGRSLFGHRRNKKKPLRKIPKYIVQHLPEKAKLTNEYINRYHNIHLSRMTPPERRNILSSNIILLTKEIVIDKIKIDGVFRSQFDHWNTVEINNDNIKITIEDNYLMIDEHSNITRQCHNEINIKSNYLVSTDPIHKYEPNHRISLFVTSDRIIIIYSKKTQLSLVSTNLSES